ncbi:hypothetical protein AAFF_G00087470 [Aldrovandia affinis]|uniref:Uncharacterized protein n=1 Tax=Aldrovandia affinis TaxID=143900 RepID=A0AAD7RWC1_9TELE|nr:hypothetical protein AAFF_G00087470 [Aldrovandia affinis]
MFSYLVVSCFMSLAAPGAIKDGTQTLQCFEDRSQHDPLCIYTSPKEPCSISGENVKGQDIECYCDMKGAIKAGACHQTWECQVKGERDPLCTSTSLMERCNIPGERVKGKAIECRFHEGEQAENKVQVRNNGNIGAGFAGAGVMFLMFLVMFCV